MNWIGQVTHVAIKDFKQQRWPMVAYVLVAVATTIHASALPSKNELSVAMPLLVLLGIIVTASVVQNDAPSKSNEFWISRPFFPTAVLGAKVLFALVAMIALALAGETVALISFAIPAHDVVALLGQSVAAYGYWLLGAIVVAAITPDIRSFIVATLLLLVGLLTAGSSLPARSLTTLGSSPAFQAMLVTLALGGGAALLVWIYRARDVGRVVWVGATAVVAALMLRGFAIDRRSFDRQPAAGMIKPNLTLSIVDASHLADRRRIRIRFATDSAVPGQRVLFEVEQGMLHLRDGSSVALTTFLPTTTLRLGSMGLPSGIRVISEENSGDGGVVDLAVANPQRTVKPENISSLEVAGRVAIAVATPVASMPPAVGEVRANNGVRMRVSDVHLNADGSTIQLETATLFPPNDDRSTYFNPTLSIALVNDSAHEARVLHASANSSSTDWLVLPGVPILTGLLTLNGNTRPNGSDSSARDESWYRAARMSISRWDTRVRYPVQLTATMP